MQELRTEKIFIKFSLKYYSANIIDINMKKLLLLFIFFSATNVFAHNGKWTQMHPETSPPPRADYGMAYLGDDKVMIFGGYSYYPDTPTETVNDTWIYDLSENTWTEIITDIKPEPRYIFVMSRLEDGKAILFGGVSEESLYLGDTWIFDSNELSWTEIHPEKSPKKRDRAMMAYLGDNKVLMFSGVDGEIYSPETWIFDYNRLAWDSIAVPAPPARFGGRERGQISELNDNMIFLFGGYDGWYSLNDNWVYDRDLNKWDSLLISPNNFKRSSGAMAKLKDNLILLFGGSTIYDTTKFDRTEYDDDTWIFDYSKQSWKELLLDEYPKGRVLHQMSFISEGKALLFSGVIDGYLEAIPTTWLFEYEPNDIEENENDKTAGIIQSGNKVIISITSDNSIHTPELNIVDICGREIFVDYSFSNSADSSRIEFSASGLAAGVYFATVQAGAEVYWFKFFAE